MLRWLHRARTLVPGLKPERHVRRWFQDERDGTYFRNVPLIMGERKRALEAGKLDVFRELQPEIDYAFKIGVFRSETLPDGDECIQPASFRDTYPNHPGLWQLDER